MAASMTRRGVLRVFKAEPSPKKGMQREAVIFQTSAAGLAEQELQLPVVDMLPCVKVPMNGCVLLCASLTFARNDAVLEAEPKHSFLILKHRSSLWQCKLQAQGRLGCVKPIISCNLVTCSPW